MVMDYPELKPLIESHTEDDEIVICTDKVRKWRQLNLLLKCELKVEGLKSAYLQIHVSKDLWQYQVVKFNGVHYALTRLGFGLTSAVRIMTMRLGKVLSLDDEIRRATDNYIVDIMGQEFIVSASAYRNICGNMGSSGRNLKAFLMMDGFLRSLCKELKHGS